MEIFKAVEVTDGAGVRLLRYIGTPHLREIDPFLLLDEFKSDSPEDYKAGFPPHPHRGFQTLTYMIQGRFEHRDSTGERSTLESGHLQWMNAGKGVIHSEMPLMENGKLWGFQLWLNNPAKFKMSTPFYYNYRVQTLVEEEGLKIMDLVGKPVKKRGFYPLTYLHLELKSRRRFEIELEPEANSFIALSEGFLNLNGMELPETHIAVFRAAKVSLRAERDAVLLLGSARALGEPIVRWGPFVMNTPEEIEQAVRDFRANVY